MNETNNIIPKQEAHLWLSLHEFFTSEQLRESYEITQFRKKNLMQVNLIKEVPNKYFYINRFILYVSLRIKITYKLYTKFKIVNKILT
jgi:hypothetical protein